MTKASRQNFDWKQAIPAIILGMIALSILVFEIIEPLTRLFGRIF